MLHIVRTTHWTYCSKKTRMLGEHEMVTRGRLAAELRGIRPRPEPGTCPEGVCPDCYRRWKEDRQR